MNNGENNTRRWTAGQEHGRTREKIGGTLAKGVEAMSWPTRLKVAGGAALVLLSCGLCGGIGATAATQGLFSGITDRFNGITRSVEDFFGTSRQERAVDELTSLPDEVASDIVDRCKPNFLGIGTDSRFDGAFIEDGKGNIVRGPGFDTAMEALGSEQGGVNAETIDCIIDGANQYDSNQSTAPASSTETPTPIIGNGNTVATPTVDSQTVVPTPSNGGGTPPPPSPPQPSAPAPSPTERPLLIE